jgi:hypothetical protein
MLHRCHELLAGPSGPSSRSDHPALRCADQHRCLAQRSFLLALSSPATSHPGPVCQAAELARISVTGLAGE